MAGVACFQWIEAPEPNFSSGDPQAFLSRLGGPAVIVLPGRDNSRCRGFVTLSHGNEPSGFYALQRYLQSGQQPAVKMVCVLPSVQAALGFPAFSQRMLPGKRDLNRCFRPPFNDEQGELAEAVLQVLRQCQPEAIVDMHNTSGSGPAFGVVTYMDWRHDALVSLFTQRMVVTGLSLGSLMEISEPLCPTVTIEVGGRLDESAHELAYEGLCRYFNDEQVLAPQEADWDLERLFDPVRLELRPDTRLAYAEGEVSGVDLTLKTDIEHFNFGGVKAGTLLGWSRGGEDLFSALDKNGNCALDKLVEIRDRGLYTASDLKLFMITNNPDIAVSDCLFYAVADDGQAICA